MLKMRLQRIGRKNRPAYRVLVVDSRQGPKSGKYVDQVGTYNPLAGDIQIDGEKAKDWVAKGVQLSPTVHNMLVDQKVIESKKVNALPKKRPIVKESEETAETTPDAAPEAASTESAEKKADDAEVETNEIETNEVSEDPALSEDAPTKDDQAVEAADDTADAANTEESAAAPKS